LQKNDLNFKIRVDSINAFHVCVSLFSWCESGTYAKNGSLVFTLKEWDVFARTIIQTNPNIFIVGEVNGQNQQPE
jgi:hypothetical protein